MIIDLMKKQVQTFKTKLPVSKKTVQFRPLLVKEEKLITEINELDSSIENRLSNLSKLVDSCCVDIDSKNLNMYDFQHMLIELRKRSFSEISELNITCPVTSEKININLDLNSGVSNKTDTEYLEIELNSIFLKFKKPTISDLIQSECLPKTYTDLINLMGICLVDIETDKQKLNMSSISIKEKMESLEYLPKSSFEKIKNFILNTFVEFKIHYVTSDGITRTIEIKDFVTFLKFFLVILR
jgi:hypothetical protein